MAASTREDLSQQLETPQCECLNASKEHTLKDALDDAGDGEDRGAAEEQLRGLRPPRLVCVHPSSHATAHSMPTHYVPTAHSNGACTLCALCTRAAQVPVVVLADFLAHAHHVVPVPVPDRFQVRQTLAPKPRQ